MTDTLDPIQVGYSGSFGQYRFMVRTSSKIPMEKPDGSGTQERLKLRKSQSSNLVLHTQKRSCFEKGDTFQLNAQVNAHPQPNLMEWRVYDPKRGLNSNQHIKTLGRSKSLVYKIVDESLDGLVIRLYCKNDVGEAAQKRFPESYKGRSP